MSGSDIFTPVTANDSRYKRSIERLFLDSPTRRYQKNQLLHYQGDPLSQIYLIRSGYVKAYTILDSGDTRTMLLMSESDIFPLAFSSSTDWSDYKIKYFYQALTDCELAVLTAETLRRQMNEDQETMNTYMNVLSASNDTIMHQLEVMKNKKAIDKVGMMLPYLVSKAGRQIQPGVYELQLKFSHQEIADLSGVTRETATTLIKQLEKEGIIDQSNGKWRVSLTNLDNKLSAD